MNDNVLKVLDKLNGRLSQGGAVLDEDIYVIRGQQRSFLSPGTFVEPMAVDYGETADCHKDNNPTLF